MCAIDLESLRPSTRQDRQGGVCEKCGYDLTGLPHGARCPECGHEVGRSMLRPKRREYIDKLSDAPIGWLRTFSRASAAAVFSPFLLLASVVLWYTAPPAVAALVLLASTFTWYGAAFFLTQPRPAKAVNGSPREEWSKLRLAARTLEAAWVIAAVIYATTHVSPPTGAMATLAEGVLLLCVLAGMAGLVPLLFYVSNIMYWATDTDLANRMSGSAVVVGIGVGLTAVFGSWNLIGGALMDAIRILLFIFLVATFTLLIVAPSFLLLLALFSLHRTAHWAIVNRATQRAIEDRRRKRDEADARLGDRQRAAEKAAAEREAAERRAPKPPSPPPHAGGGEAEDGGYRLAD